MGMFDSLRELSKNKEKLKASNCPFKLYMAVSHTQQHSRLLVGRRCPFGASLPTRRLHFQSFKKIKTNSSSSLWDLLQMIMTGKKYFLVIVLFIHFNESLLLLFRPTGKILRDMATRFRFHSLNYPQKARFPQTRFPLILSSPTELWPKRPHIQTPHTE